MGEGLYIIINAKVVYVIMLDLRMQKQTQGVWPSPNLPCLGRPQHCCPCCVLKGPLRESSDLLMQALLYPAVCTDVSQEFLPSVLQDSTSN